MKGLMVQRPSPKIFGLEPPLACRLFCPLTEELQYVLSMKSGSIVHRCTIPTVSWHHWNATLFHKESDTFQVSLGRGEMESGATVVVSDGHILVGKRHPSECCQITIVRGEQKIHNLSTLYLGVLESRIDLLRSPLPVVVVVEVELVHQHLTELHHTQLSSVVNLYSVGGPCKNFYTLLVPMETGMNTLQCTYLVVLNRLMTSQLRLIARHKCLL